MVSLFIEVHAEPVRDLGQWRARPRRRPFANDARDLLFLAAEIFEPYVDERCGHRREPEGVNADMELVLERSVLAARGAV